jgi:type III secretion protein Q
MNELELETLAPEEVALGNESAGLGRRATLPLPSGRLGVRFITPPPHYAPAAEVEVRLGDERAAASVAGFDALLARSGLFESGPPVAVPGTLRGAVLAVVLEPALAAIAARLGARVTDVREVPAGETLEGGPALWFALEDAGRVETLGRVRFGPRLAPAVLQALRAQPVVPSRDPGAVVLAGSVEVGRTYLSPADVGRLERHDVILADEVVTEPEVDAVVRWSPGLAFAARRDGEGLVLGERVGRPREPGTVPGDPATGAEPVALALCFEAGRVELPAAQVGRLAPGSTVPFPAGTAGSVVVRCGGRAIGAGHLVRFADRVGLRLTEWPGGGPGPAVPRAAGLLQRDPRRNP